MAAGTADRGGPGSLQGLGRAVVLLGPPGAGKGTQAQRIAQRYRLPHLSTGEMFRDNIRRDTELGRAAKPWMDRGELVPDEIVLGMFEDRINHTDCDNGFVSDGFPRTLVQAYDLDRVCQRRNFADAIVLYVDVPRELLMRRLMGRRICKSGHIYNIYDHPPKREGICDFDGTALVHRQDDTESVISERLLNYDAQTLPLVDYYRSRGVLRSVDATGDVDAVAETIRKILDGAEVPQ